MQFGIIGTGSVGAALATGLLDAGRDVVLGSRDPSTGHDEFGDSVDVRTQREAAKFGDVVVLAVPGRVVVDVASTLGDELAGKPVVDTTNEYPAPSESRSLAARIADAAPDASVVKAFNTIGANRMTSPVVDGERATMFVAGDDPAARETIESLATDLGFEPIATGGLETADHLENLARFWIFLSQTRGRDIGFRLLSE